MKFILKSLTFILFVGLTISCSSDSDSQTTVVTPKCTPIPCLNGGVSTPNCGCTCPQGFSGANCSTQITPTKITITKIRVKKFPNLKPNGNNWDSAVLPGFEKPDIFPVLFSQNGTSVLFAGVIKNDSFSYGNDNFDFIPTTPIEITKITEKYIITLWDDDTILTIINQELMGSIDFNIYTSTGGFPTTIILSNPTSLVGFELTVTYTW